MTRTRSKPASTWGRTVLGVALVASMAQLLGAGPAGAIGPPASLTGATSYRPAQLAAVGRTTSYVVVNDQSNRVIYLANPGGRGAATVLARDAQAEAVSGDMVEYRTTDGAQNWTKLITGAHGQVPATWAFLAPDGGMRVRQSGGQAFLDYLHISGTTESWPLPAGLPTSGAHYSVVAGPSGVAVTDSTATAAPKVVFSTLAAPVTFSTVSTAGLPAGVTLTCPSLSVHALGCLATHRAVRLTIGANQPAQISTFSATPFDIAVTDTYTSWTGVHKAGSTACPCDLISLDSTGTATSIEAGVTAGAITSGSGRFYYSSETARPNAGVYLTMNAAGGRTLVMGAPARPLTATAPTLGPGRAAWVDDSRAGGPVRTANVAADGKVSAIRNQTSGAALLPVGVSGLRTVYATPRGSLRRKYDGGIDSVIAAGGLIAVSGTRVLYRAANAHLVLLDLVHQTSTDVSTHFAAQSASLWGTYLSYVRTDGSVWRTDLAGGAPARLAAAAGRPTSSTIVSWGDWVAWTLTGAHPASAYRNAVASAAARPVPAGLRIAGASAAGLLVARGSAFEILAWATGAKLVDVPGNSGPAGGIPSVDGGLVAWRRDGVPAVASLGVKVVDRPRALGNPSAPTTLKRGRSWRFELPTSAPLTHCAVTLHRGSYSTTLPCSAKGLPFGEVLALWTTRTSLPAGWYQWAVTGSNADGSLLNRLGAARASTGWVRVS